MVKFPAISAFVLLSSMTALDAGSVQNTSFVPAPKSTAASPLELEIIAVRESVSGEASVTVPTPISKAEPPCAWIQ